MIIARKLRETNRAEYLLYMWQVEDLLRANELNLERLSANYLSRFDYDQATKHEVAQWYADLIDMMRQEGVTKSGHLQINRNTLAALEELHAELMRSDKFPYYHRIYYAALPYIVELRSKGEDKNKGELEVCFDALYGIMMLRLQGRKVSEETSKAAACISKLLGQLSDYFNKNSKEPIDF